MGEVVHLNLTKPQEKESEEPLPFRYLISGVAYEEEDSFGNEEFAFFTCVLNRNLPICSMGELESLEGKILCSLQAQDPDTVRIKILGFSRFDTPL